MSTPNTHHGARAISAMLEAVPSGKIFFCGVGGISMSSLAELSIMDGYRTAGSDRTESGITRRLSSLGCEVHIGHEAKNVEDADIFVYTVAISPDNPEYVRAGELSIPRISRADYLGYLMTRRKSRIGISGTHGKSTCTAMCASIFAAAERDPVVMCGAEMIGSGGGSCVLGGGDSFIFEACEYMDSFLDFNPTAAVILNVEHDHVDYFSDIAQMRASFKKFADITQSDGEGCAIYNRDCAETVLALKDFEGKRYPFGICDGDSELSERDGFSAVSLVEERGRYSFDVKYNGVHLCHVRLSVPGRHNVYNALAAAAAAYNEGISPVDISEGLASFKGTRRRMEFKGSRNGADFYDDYAHHPTEIEASLRSARKFSSGRLICAFQSHTYSRTAALLEGFASSLSLADKVLIAPIYSARETDTLGVDQFVLANAVNEASKEGKSCKTAIGFGNFDEIVVELLSDTKPEDTVIVMGAGDLCLIFPKLGLK